MKKEHITTIGSNSDWWICLCGNNPSAAGFYAINDNNEEVEPTPEDWTTNHYFCNSCGRVIDFDTLEVVRQVPIQDIKMLTEPILTSL